MNIPLKPKEIIQVLQHYNHEAYFVGGAVRDSMMGLKIKDYDIATSATPDEISHLFRNKKLNFVGASFGVMLVDGIEVATFRKDRYFGLSDKNVEITYSKDIFEDLQRRDFTINAMAYNPMKSWELINPMKSWRLIDPFNGYDDLRARVIRFVGSAEDRIKEDPNRIIRACRFVAKIDGVFDHGTKRYLRKHGNLVKTHVAPERIRMEILKAMELRYASKFFRAMFDIGILGYVFPSLLHCYNHPHGKYHIENVFDHSMLVGDHISIKYPLLKLVGYLHDVGKPGCWDGENFIDHENLGADFLERELAKLRFSTHEINFISNMTRLHMIHFTNMGPKGFRKTLLKYHKGELNWKDVLRLHNADKIGNLSREVYREKNILILKDIVKKIKIELNRDNAPVTGLKSLAINGDTVMEITGLKPGKLVGLLLNQLFAKVVEEPELNNQDSLISLTKELFQNS